jgi:SAM-dependent methyltransferase
VSDQIQFDETESRVLEAVYRTPDVVAQRRAVVQALGLRPGERVLDLGSGPGFLAAEMAAAVGPGGQVQGVDVSASMLAMAARRERPEGSAPMEFTESDVTDLPFDAGSFDAAVCTQVYEYVADMPSALAEAGRVLTDGGRLLVLDTDWDSIVWRSSDDERMARVLRAWDDHLVHRDLPRRLPQLLRDAGLSVERCDVIPLLNVGYEQETYSAGMMVMVQAYVTGRRGVTAADAQAWADDLRGLGDDYFFSLNRYLFLARK